MASVVRKTFRHRIIKYESLNDRWQRCNCPSLPKWHSNHIQLEQHEKNLILHMRKTKAEIRSAIQVIRAIVFRNLDNE